MIFKFGLLLLALISYTNSYYMWDVEYSADFDPKINPEVFTRIEYKIDENIKKVERYYEAVEKRFIPRWPNEIEILFKVAIYCLDNIIIVLRDQASVNLFLEDSGLVRVIYPFLESSSPSVRYRILLILRILFEVAPETLNSQILENTADKLLKIFVNDDNLTIKKLALDILIVWLPNNPKIQQRIVKAPGAEDIYNTIPKLDLTIINSLLRLFNKTLKEHNKVMNEPETPENAEFRKMYEDIGLTNKLSSENVCSGMFKIFETVLKDNDKLYKLGIVFETMADIAPYCSYLVRVKTNYVKLFSDFLEYVKRLHIILPYYYDIFDMKTILDEYINQLMYKLDL